MPRPCDNGLASRLLLTPRGPVEYAEHGSGPPLLSFHGTPGGFDGALLAAQMHCGAGFRTIGFSRPGYLRTPLTSGSSVSGQADLAAALLDALEIPSALVYGLSGGGPYALSFAARRPAKCRALVLAAAVTAPEPNSARWLELEMRLLPALTPAAWILSRAAPGSQMSRILNVIAPFGPRAAGYRNDAIAFRSFEPIPLESIDCPVLIAHGESDRHASFADATRAAARIRRAKTLFVKGAGHMSLWWRPGVRDTVAAFLKQYV